MTTADAVTPQPHHGPNDPDFRNQDTPPRPASASTDRRTPGRPTSADEAVAIAELVDQGHAAGYTIGCTAGYLEGRKAATRSIDQLIEKYRANFRSELAAHQVSAVVGLVALKSARTTAAGRAS